MILVSLGLGGVGAEESGEMGVVAQFTEKKLRTVIVDGGRGTCWARRAVDW